MPEILCYKISENKVDVPMNLFKQHDGICNECKEKMNQAEWMARMNRAKRTTCTMLDTLSQEAGYPYKQFTVNVLSYKDSPTWDNGKIEIGYNNEPESVAHEIGHGLHEKIRETGKSDILGEEFVEAIRYYVEFELSTNSLWLREFRIEGNPFTANYTFQQFVIALEDRSLFTRVGWQ